jgi:hypothetical protein
MQFDLRRLSVMKSVPSAVADGCLIGDIQKQAWLICLIQESHTKAKNPSATADGTDLIATARPLTQTASLLVLKWAKTKGASPFLRAKRLRKLNCYCCS